ncbi:MAG: T9SS type A sorting domain-containing protein, partial [Muribaculaceae bacterium]|nr:T9SS type A sorting domain-containing protein [Muribaculaceae bacterium]
PVTMKAGSQFSIYFVCNTTDYNDDHYPEAMIGTDPANMTAWCTSGSIYAKRDGSLYEYPTSYNRTYTVTADGDYYIGIRTQSRSKGGQMFVYTLYCDEILDTPAGVTNLKATAKEAEECEATLTWKWPSKTKGGVTLADGDITSAKIFRKKDSKPTDVKSDAFLVATLDGGKPGEEGSWTDTEFPEGNGSYYYVVIPFTENGASETQTSTDCWVGEDVKIYNPLASTFTLANPSGKVIEMTFTPRLEGYNKGWVNPEKVTYKIVRRIKGSGSYASWSDDKVLEEDWVAETFPYVDNTIEQGGTYKYTVTVKYDGNPGTSVDSPEISLIDPVSLPYYDDFSENTLSNYVLANTNASYAWRYYYNYLSHNSSSYSQATSTLITAPMALEKGKTYRVAANVWTECEEEDDPWGWGSYPGDPAAKDFAITAGNAASDAAQKVLLQLTVATDNESNLVETYFSPEESGNYCFGFRSISKSSERIYMRNIAIEESSSSPAPVSGLTVTPGEAGALKAKIEFTLPSVTNTGTELGSISSLIITRQMKDGEPQNVAYDGELTPGAAVVVNDNVESDGLYTYTVSCTEGESESDAVVSEALWIGFDIPAAISSYYPTPRYEINAEGYPEVSVGRVSKGLNNGYFDADNVTYRFVRLPDNYEVPQELVELDETTARITDVTVADVPFGLYTYQVTPVNGHMEGTSYKFYSSYPTGDAVELPYTADLSAEDPYNLWEGRGWVFDEVSGLYRYHTPVSTGDFWQTTYMPPFRINEPFSMTLNLELSATGEEAKTLHIYLCTIETVDPVAAPKNEGDSQSSSSMAATPILGSENRTLVESIEVSGAAGAPVAHEVAFDVVNAGRYRIGLQGDAAAEGEYIQLHNATLSKGMPLALQTVAADSNGIRLADGMIMLPEGCVKAELFNTAGMLITATTAPAISTSALPEGIYIVRAVMTDGTTLTSRVVAK